MLAADFPAFLYCAGMKRLSFPLPNHSPRRRILLSALATICLATLSSYAQEKAVDLAKLQVSLPSKEGATSEMTKDELDDAPVLKLVLPEGEYEAWRGSLRLELPPPAAGNYTVIFHANADPGDCYIDMRVYDFAGTPNRQIVGPKSFLLQPDWQEYVYDFTIENTETAPLSITWGGLARQGKTISFRDVKLIKN